MVMRIERSRLQGLTVFVLSGNFDENYTEELERLFGPRPDYSKIILDLADVRLADHTAIRFLMQCEGRGIRLDDCPRHIREWITVEHIRVNQQSMDKEKG
jgi:hypothetical protein